MAMTSKQLRNQLSAIAADHKMYAGIGPSEIAILKRLLNDKEPWMSCRAVFALSKIADAKALTILTQAAGDSRSEVRVAVAASARNLKPAAASNLLLKLLADPELGVRKFAVEAVSKAHSAAVHRRLKDIEVQDPALPIRAIANDRLRALKLIGL